MWARILSVIAVAGCGRIGFDPSGDGGSGGDDSGSSGPCVAGHDEDGDGIDDCADVCPHVADPGQVDRDGDGVGDVCDPHPDTPGDHIAFFDPFISARGVWSFSAPPVQGADSLDFDAVGNTWSASLSVVPAKDLFELGVHIGAQGTQAVHDLSIQLVDMPREYSCELRDTGSTFLEFTFGDGTSTMHGSLVSIGDNLHNLDLAFQAVNAPPMLNCAYTAPSGNSGVFGTIPINDHPARVSIVVIDLAVELDYVIQIHTD